MTTILCTAGGVFAADRQLTTRDVIHAKPASKIEVGQVQGKVYMLGVSGSGADEERLMHAFLKRRPLAEECKSRAIVVEISGRTGYNVFHVDSLGTVHTVKGENFAIGSGAAFAIGAMDAGAGAARALLIASKRDPWTGNGFEVFGLGLKGTWWRDPDMVEERWS